MAKFKIEIPKRHLKIPALLGLGLLVLALAVVATFVGERGRYSGFIVKGNDAQKVPSVYLRQEFRRPTRCQYSPRPFSNWDRGMATREGDFGTLP